MLRLGFVLSIVLALLWGGFLVGKNWGRAEEEGAAADTLERIDNADVGEGDAVEDAGWIDRFLDRVRPGE